MGSVCRFLQLLFIYRRQNVPDRCMTVGVCAHVRAQSKCQPGSAYQSGQRQNMLSVRPSRCHGDTVCFSQVVLGNHLQSNQPVWVPTAGHSSPFFCLCSLPFISLPAFLYFSIFFGHGLQVQKWKINLKCDFSGSELFWLMRIHTNTALTSPSDFCFGSYHVQSHSTFVFSSLLILWIVQLQPDTPTHPPQSPTHTYTHPHTLIMILFP